jgi:hypothetical protein
VRKGAGGAFISLEAVDAAGNITVKVETGSEPTQGLNEVTGIYPVTITSGALPNDINTNLIITEGPDNTLIASATVEDTMVMQFALSGLKRYDTENGTAVTGYYFMIPEQDLSIMMMLMPFKGRGTYNGYDGKIYRSEMDSFVSFEVVDGSGVIRIKVESVAG